MLKSLRLFVGLGVVAVALGLSGGVSHAIPDGEWGTFENVPGLVLANVGSNAAVNSVSCGSPGNCSAGGFYVDGFGHQQAFVVSQVDGVWQSFEDVNGLVAANTGGSAGVNRVSCASAGNCSATGVYADGSDTLAFVVSQVDGVWQSFEEVPGLNTAASGPIVSVNSLSCTSAGNCSAGGIYSIGSAYNTQAFVVSQVDGVWQTFEDVPGLAAVNTGASAEILSISCASAGNCSAVGRYTNGSGSQGFVVSQIGGVWLSFGDVPGLLAANVGDDARMNSVSCASAGNCSAVGYYASASFSNQLIVVSQVNGVWQTFEEVPGLAAVNTGGSAELLSISCASIGNCSVGGYYYLDPAGYQAIVVSQVGGVWQLFEDLPGMAAANVGGEASVNSVSCTSAGNCSAGGYFLDGVGYEAFVVSQVGGVWQQIEVIPGLVDANIGADSSINSLSCASAGNCSAAGYFADGAGYQGLLVSISTTSSNTTSSTTLPAAEESTTVPSTDVANGSSDSTLASSTTSLVANLPATGSHSSSTLMFSLLLLMSGALVVISLRQRTN